MGELMDFGAAIRALKEGKKVARHGWNGKGQFVYYVPPGHYAAQTPAAKTVADEDGKVAYRAYLALKTVQGDIATWVPSISDCLAEDWVIVEAGDTPERDIIRVEAGVRYPEDGHIGGERDDNDNPKIPETSRRKST